MRHWLWVLGLSFLLNAEIIWQANIQKPFALTTQLSSQQITLDEELNLENVLPLPSSTTPLSSAPLIPLEPQFPLELTQANEQLLINNPKRLEEAKKSIQNDLEKHSFPWLTIAILLGCGGIGWVMYLTRDRWPKRPVKVAPVLPPKQQLDHALLALQKRQLLEHAQLQELYGELASILLTALQWRLGSKTKKMTTTEIEQEFKKSSPLSASQQQRALSFLAEADQVKFAGKKPLEGEVKQFYQQIQSFIQELL